MKYRIGFSRQIIHREVFSIQFSTGYCDGYTGALLKVGMACVILIWLATHVNPIGAAENNAASEEFVKKSAPVFKKFCFECHGDKKTKGKINLENLTREVAIADNFKSWEQIALMLEEKEMPPDDELQPSDDQRQELIAMIRDELDRSVHLGAGDPGRVVLRHLTSAEYSYTIKDLTGLNLGLERMFVSEAVGGEGFSNVGDVQFMQDSTIERYLEAAKIVASHAVIGAGPLQFYQDPGKTGQELSAIHRIKDIYRRHGFRTGAGEGAEAFGLDRYSKAFYAAWRFLHKNELGAEDSTLKKLADEEGIESGFVEHIWKTLHEPSPSFPSTEIVTAWKNLPAPGDGSGSNVQAVRIACDDLYTLLYNWQIALAANSSDDEESPVLVGGNFRPSQNHSFRVRVNWPEEAEIARIELSVIPASGKDLANPAVVWKEPRLFFRQAVRRGRPQAKPLREVLSDESVQKLAFGSGFNGTTIDPDEFVTFGPVALSIEIPIPEGMTGAFLMVEPQLDIEQGDDCLVRCIISDGIVEGETVASTGASSALLANPDSPEIQSWRKGINEFARKLPQVSHREPAPSDRDPIPAPFDNTYNNAERNDFHYIIKYHRDDAFLAEHMLDEPTRTDLDQAWIDLLSAFDYHDTFLRFVAKKFEIDLEERGVADLSLSWIDALPEEPWVYIRNLYDHYADSERHLRAVQNGHVEDVIHFSRLAWRRPLTGTEENRLQDFYTNLRADAKLNHEEAIRSLLARVLVAPSFLFRTENPPESEEIVPLANWELANRLSYFLWSSPPDAELRRAAEDGELKDSIGIVRQARRMLGDPKARRFATEFFGQWFGFYRFNDYGGIDTGRFSEFTDTLKSAMYDEAVSFFEHIVRTDRPVSDILFADYTFLNQGLAEHYGIETAAAPTNKVALVQGVNQFKRGGLLQLGAVLTVTSAPLRTSAVKRGDWILRRVLGTPVPTPPADVGSIPADDVLADGRTVRERLEAHRTDASCVNCHSRIDPLGFSLEHFDPIGRWRETYRDGNKIDSAGILNDGTAISGLNELHGYLQTQEAAYHRNLCVKLMGYALGRGELVSDRPLIEQMTASMSSDDRFSNLIVQIITSTQFRNQRGSNAAESQPARELASRTKGPSL